ncbi:TetR/AcrR family transcriptional regulator [Pararobbsia silviterrae]|uniref:TetR/AcrR family transcriptional regulator n=1 Tax=Pararobbsia silviterrae TaxID=1792498 RepID=A0A494XQD8_9BURK|nr:TetR/AcrR family transcriptional regulator [Pararobbsia silviterrae]RKP50324.1 TetR/AcrR family transcriptional regulator [Pararobbsia silviterrae]
MTDRHVTTRETGKHARRAAILQAAETLIRRSGSTDFSMQELAAESQLSLATTYNLIGGKSTVLYALLNLRADHAHIALDMRPDTDPRERVFTCAREVVRQFTGDPLFYRPLMRFLLGVPDPVHHPAFMARGLEHWCVVMDALERAGGLPQGTHAREVANFVHLFLTGALDMWVHEEYDEARLLHELERYLTVLLFPVTASKPSTKKVRRT